MSLEDYSFCVLITLDFIHYENIMNLYAQKNFIKTKFYSFSSG